MANGKKVRMLCSACAVGAVVAAMWAGGDVWRFAGPFALIAFVMDMREL